MEPELDDDDLDDIRAYDRAKAEAQDFIPAEAVYAMLDGASPVRIWREHRGLARAALAEASGVDEAVLARIEAGEVEPSAELRAALAAALAVDPEDLIPAAQARAAAAGEAAAAGDG